MHMNMIKLLTNVCLKIVTSISLNVFEISPQSYFNNIIWIHKIPSQSFNLQKILSPAELVLKRSLLERYTSPAGHQIFSSTGFISPTNGKFPSSSLPLRLLQINGKNPLILNRVIPIQTSYYKDWNRPDVSSTSSYPKFTVKTGPDQRTV